MRRQRWVIWLAGTLLLTALTVVAATGCSPQATYPTKAIEYVVGFAAGGGSDVVARITAKHLSAELGVPINVVNKGGGNSIPAILSVLNASGDGYTLMQEAPATSSLHGLLKDLPYKLEERTWGPSIAESAYAYYVNGKSPWNSLKDVAEAAKKDPASFSWASLGGASFTDFTLLRFFDAAGVDLSKTKIVPYDGAGPALTAVAGGHVMFGGTAASAVFPLRASGDIKVLAVTGDKRLSALPDVPTAKEAGFDVPFSGWFGFSGPKKLPKEVMERIDKASQKLAKDPAFAKDLEAAGAQPKYIAPDQIWPMVQRDMDLFKGLSEKSAGLKLKK